MISGRIKVSQFTKVHLKLQAKFGDDPLFIQSRNLEWVKWH